VDVDEHGVVTSSAVEGSSGHADLDKAAIEAVSRWTFEPRRCSGLAQASHTVIPITFSASDLGEPAPWDDADSGHDATLSATTVVIDTEPLEFKTVAEGLKYLRRDAGIKEVAKSGTLYFFDPRNRRFWIVRPTESGSFGAIQRVRMELTPSGNRQLYTQLCEMPADLCQLLSEYQLDSLRKGFLPVPPSATEQP
jgi:TonB family protein